MYSSPITTTFRALNLSQTPQETDRRTQEAIDKARLALGHGDMNTAVHDLHATLGRDKRAFHEAILSLLDSCPHETRQTLIEQAHSRQPDFDFNATGKDENTLLDLAVQQKDRKLALYLLSKGATAASTETQPMLTVWRRQDMLYAHFKGNKISWTSLDHALYDGHYDKAQDLLMERLGEENLNKFWEVSLLCGCYDALRAILILGMPERLRALTKQQPEVGRWMEELHDDPGLVAVLKEFPYQSKVPENFNGRATFTNSMHHIVCTHLATYQQEQQARDPSGKIKFDYSQFESPQHIAEHVKPEIYNTYATLTAHATETHLIDNASFGQFLARQFAAMEKENKPTRLMLIETTEHLMNLGLRIKEKDGKKSYVVKFFDPNQTTQGTRSKSRSLQTLETQTIDDYIANERLARHYYPEEKGASLIFVRSEPNTQAGTSSSTPSPSHINRTLTSHIDPKDIDGAIVWYLMRHGFDGNLKQLHEHFNKLTDEQRISLLSWKNSRGTPALYVSMQEGHADALKEYGKLLASIKNIPEQHLINLIAGKNKNSQPALFIGMVKGHADAIKEYGKLLTSIKNIPEHDLIDLIAGKSNDGFPVIATGMLQGHTEALKEYKEIWKLVPADRQAELLLAKVSEGPNEGNDPLRVALKRRKFGMAHDLIHMLAQLAPQLSVKMRHSLRKELANYASFISEIEHKYRQTPSRLPPYWKIQNEIEELRKKLNESGETSSSSAHD